MPHVTNGDVKIHFECTGKGAPLVLQHGWTNSIEYWRDFGYVDELDEDYQLILIDARGHGASDFPTDPELCQTRAMAEDVLVVLNALGVERAHFFGYSMGGWIGFDLTASAPERFNSMIIGGAHPYAEDLSPLRGFISNGTSEVVAAWEAIAAPLSRSTRRALLDHDLTPLQASASHDREDISSSLSGMPLPCLAFAGEIDPRYDGMQRWASSVPGCTFVSLPELDHLQAWARSDLVLPHVKEFLAGLASTRP